MWQTPLFSSLTGDIPYKNESSGDNVNGETEWIETSRNGGEDGFNSQNGDATYNGPDSDNMARSYDLAPRFVSLSLINIEFFLL